MFRTIANNFRNRSLPSKLLDRFSELPVRKVAIIKNTKQFKHFDFDNIYLHAWRKF